MKSLENTPYESIKAHLLDPENSPLPAVHQEKLERIISAAKVLDKNPIQKNAVAIHMAKFSTIGKTQAYEDIRMAMRLFNSLHTFDFDFYHTWMLNDIIENILTCRKTKSEKDRRIIAIEHSNLIRIIGRKPEELSDPSRTEKHQFYIMIQKYNQTLKLNPDDLKMLPLATQNEIHKMIFNSDQLDDNQITEIMNS